MKPTSQILAVSLVAPYWTLFGWKKKQWSPNEVPMKSQWSPNEVPISHQIWTENVTTCYNLMDVGPLGFHSVWIKCTIFFLSESPSFSRLRLLRSHQWDEDPRCSHSASCPWNGHLLSDGRAVIGEGKTLSALACIYTYTYIYILCVCVYVC